MARAVSTPPDAAHPARRPARFATRGHDAAAAHLAALLADTSNAWELQPDGAWERLADTGISSFETLRQVALAASQA